MSITMNLTLQSILGKRWELARSKNEVGICDHSGNVHIINGIQSKAMSMSSPFNSPYLIQELTLKNQQTLNYLKPTPLENIGNSKYCGVAVGRVWGSITSKWAW